MKNQKTDTVNILQVVSVLNRFILLIFVISSFNSCGTKVNPIEKQAVIAVDTTPTPSSEVMPFNLLKGSDKEGLTQTFHNNGQLKTSGHFVAEKKEGLHKEWAADGILILEGIYKNGKANGLMKWFHDAGHLAGSGNMKDDIREGRWKICDIEPNGFCIDANFENGVRSGIWRVNHHNGKLAREQTWKDDKIIAEKCWDEAGQLIDCK